MGLELEYADGQTPLDEDEKEGLLIPTIATRAKLDEFEQQNIEHAIQWTLGRTFKFNTVFTEDFVKLLHKRMYNHVLSLSRGSGGLCVVCGAPPPRISTGLTFP